MILRSQNFSIAFTLLIRFASVIPNHRLEPVVVDKQLLELRKQVWYDDNCVPYPLNNPILAY